MSVRVFVTRTLFYRLRELPQIAGHCNAMCMKSNTRQCYAKVINNLCSYQQSEEALVDLSIGYCRVFLLLPPV